MVDHPRLDLPPPGDPEPESAQSHLGYVLMALLVMLVFWGFLR